MRAMNGPGPAADASNAGEGCDERRRLLVSRQTGRGEQEGLDLRVHERLTFQGAAADVAALREKRPPPRSDRGQQRLVVGAGVEVVREHFDVRAGFPQRVGDQLGAEVVIDQEDGLRRP